jgi:hypothetical protein
LEGDSAPKAIDVDGLVSDPFISFEQGRFSAWRSQAFAGQAGEAKWIRSIGSWEIGTGKSVASVPYPESLESNWRPLDQGRRVLALDTNKRLVVFEMPSGKECFRSEPVATDRAFQVSWDGRVAAVKTDGGVQLYRLPDPPAAKDKPVATEPGKIELLRRIPVSAPGFFFYDIDISKGGKYALVTRDMGGRNELNVFDLQTGARLFAAPGYKAGFLDDEHVVAANEGTLRVYEAKTGKLLRQGKMNAIWGMLIAPGGKHLIYGSPNGPFLYDLTNMKEQHSWPITRPGSGGGILFSADGKRVFVRHDEAEAWQIWDVEQNRAAEDFAWVRKQRLLRFLPDGKAILAIQDGNYAHLDAATGKVLATLRPSALPAELQPFAYVTKGHFLLGGFTDGTVRLLALATPQELARYAFPADDRIRREAGGWHACVAVSSDEQYAAVVTECSLWIFRLPPVPTAKANP